jgi:pimeloyl-ACP methyl ester carboxylesterase
VEFYGGCHAGLCHDAQLAVLSRQSDWAPKCSPLEDYMTGYAGSRFGESAKIINRDHDPMVPLSNAECLAESMPRYELTVLDAGHFAWEDKADAYADRTVVWLKRRL